MSNFKIDTFNYTNDGKDVSFRCDYSYPDGSFPHYVFLKRGINDLELYFVKDSKEFDAQYYFLETPKVVRDFIEKIGFFEVDDVIEK